MRSLTVASASHNSWFGFSSSCLANGRTGEKWGRETRRRLWPMQPSLPLICLQVLAHRNFSH